MQRDLIPLPGSKRVPMANAKVVGEPSADEWVKVTVRIRPCQAKSSIIRDLNAKPPSKRQYLSRNGLEREYGADLEDVDKIKSFAEENGLEIIEVKPGGRNIRIVGTVEAISEAFGVKLKIYESLIGKYRGREGPVSIPSDISHIVQAVLGLDNRPQAKPHFVAIKKTGISGIRPNVVGISYTPLQIAQLYNFPTGLDGSDQCIGIIELAGGYKLNEMDRYFGNLNIKTPKIIAISVDGSKNDPNNPDPNIHNANKEVDLDIQVAGAIAPKATIAVYFAPNTDNGFIDAIHAAVHDKVNNPSVISISWGSAEGFWTDQSMKAMDEEFQSAAAIGVTVCCASGDDGSRDDPDNSFVKEGIEIGDQSGNDTLAHVDFPSSSSYALGCGGTKLESSNGMISKESVWNEGPGNACGGGISDHFPLPEYQSNANVQPSSNPNGRIGRGVPDVSGNADPCSGYAVLVDGQDYVVGGTSAVAPLWAGLIALLNQSLGKPIGFLNPWLYSQPTNPGIFNDITEGNNGFLDTPFYKACRGWDACSGLGTPNGVELLQYLRRNASSFTNMEFRLFERILKIFE